MNTQSDQQLLRDFAESRSDTAFGELVRRHVDLVYSAAIRMVCAAHTAEDVTQSVFVTLAQQAPQLTAHPVLSGWLHCTTRNLAAKAVRTEVRRQAREQEAVAMNELLSTAPDATWEEIAPHLDAALAELTESDRDVVMLRYFEKKSASEMAETLGISDEAAQKRLNRAVERLRENFNQRNVSIGAGALGILLAANAVQAAPAGLAATISTAALLTGAAGTTATVIATKTIVMTTMQKILIGATVAVLAGTGIYEASQAAKLRNQNAVLQQQQTAAAVQIQQLQTERDSDSNRLAALEAKVAATSKPESTEMLKLRGEVGALRAQNRAAGEKSALSKITSDPTTRNAIREQQKYGMKAIYGDFAKKLKLSSDQKEKFNDMMADQVMDNIDRITQILHDGTSPADTDKIFADANTELEGKVQAMLGDDAVAQFKDYNQNILSTLGAAQFQDNLTGDAAEKAQKKTELQQALQQAMNQVIQQNGLPANFQFVPSLNFANFTSEATLNQNLNLLDNVLANVAANDSFLSPDEQASFQTFRTNALTNNRMLIEMNQKLMAPLSQ